jgi:hypothetical protein
MVMMLLLSKAMRVQEGKKAAGVMRDTQEAQEKRGLWVNEERRGLQEQKVNLEVGVHVVSLESEELMGPEDLMEN